MRPHALPFALGLALAASSTVPAGAFAAEPLSRYETPIAAAPAQGESAQSASIQNASNPNAPAEAAHAGDAIGRSASPRYIGGVRIRDAVAQNTAPPATQTAPAQQPAGASVPGASPAAVPSGGDAAVVATEPPTYDPVADPTLPAPAELPTIYDPWERYNRKMHKFNNAVDRGVARPLARAYVRVVPRPIRLGVSNFFDNLGQPVSALNALLQGKGKQAGQSAGRFLLNSTVGIGGIFDPATDAKIPNKSEDFGQTLGVWGWKRSRYFELPLFGPRTVRDAWGTLADAPLSPLRQVERDRVRFALQGLQLVDVRAQLLATDSLREGAEDDYTLVRDAWLQRRDYQIFGDSAANGDGLPDYLNDDTNPSVPADAMPVMPTDTNFGGNG